MSPKALSNVQLVSQTKELVKEMVKAGYPLCLSTQDWEGNYERHCNTCVKRYLEDNNK